VADNAVVEQAQDQSLPNPSSGLDADSIQPESPISSVMPPDPILYAAPSAQSSGEKILGLPAEQMGNIALGLGGAGCLFSIIGCGGLFSLLGLIAGFISLKTPGRQNGIIGMVLAGLGLVVALVFLCLILSAFMSGVGLTN
jgi:hypothetical protein